MTLPDVFLVGAPKCGTTALDEYLKQHPQVFMAARKEMHYFGSDLRFFKAPRITLAEYRAQFEPAEGRKRAGESSVWYLYSERAAEEIRRFNPQARILILLRNPVDMLYSLHSQFLYESNEDLADFASALAAEGERREGRAIPEGAYFPDGLFYRRVAEYAPQVERYLRAFGPDRVHVIRFDELRQDPAEAYRRTLRFLEVDHEYRPEFAIYNANKQVRIGRLQRFLNNPSRTALGAARILVPTPVRRALVRTLKRFNSKESPRPPLDEALRAQLQAEFRRDLERLSELLGRDFTDWFAETNR